MRNSAASSFVQRFGEGDRPRPVRFGDAERAELDIAISFGRTEGFFETGLARYSAALSFVHRAGDFERSLPFGDSVLGRLRPRGLGEDLLVALAFTLVARDALLRAESSIVGTGDFDLPLSRWNGGANRLALSTI